MRKTHGASRTRLYGIWQRIRGESSRSPWERRGVDDSWASDFASFKVWAESRGYTENSQLKRIDKLKPYSADNCYFVDAETRVKDDIINHTFGKLTVMREVPKTERKSGRRMYVCKCECGNEITVYGNNLVSGSTKSCGCMRKSKAQQITSTTSGNLRIGRLTIFEPFEENGATKYRCLCDCGKMLGISASDLANGVTSCGCVSYSSAEPNTVQRDDSRNYVFSEGDVFGSLTIIDRADKGYGPRTYLCECTCGVLVYAYGVHLKNGIVTACKECMSKVQTPPVQPQQPATSERIDIDTLLKALDEQPAPPPNPFDGWDNF